MTMRTIRLLGYTTGATASIEWNGAPAWSGTIEAAGSFDTPATLAEWQSDRSVTGSVPFTIQCHSGEVMLVTFHANWIRPMRQRLLDPDAEWPMYRPTLQELDRDRKDQDFDYETKYGLDRAALDARILTVTVQSAAENFCEPFRVTPESDGKDNVQINQEPQMRLPASPHEGQWHWPAIAGSVLSCSVRIDPDLIKTE
jgi:hypothetical protein